MSNISSPQTHPRIAIIGGGPGGLTLLLTLFKCGIPATLYEREADKDSRAFLGGILDLEWETGQCALRENGTEDAFRKFARREAEETKLCGKDGVPIFHEGGTELADANDLKHARPEIDRRVLRGILLDAVPQDAIKWDHALTAVRPLQDGQHELMFANGLVVTTDIVIGADGARSRIRPLVSSAVPLYHGVTGAEISLPPAVAALPENHEICEHVGKGSCYLVEDAKVLCFQRNGDGRIRVYAWHPDGEDWTLPRDPKEAKKVLHGIYAEWAPWVHDFIERSDEGAIYLRPLYYLPVGHRWDHKSGVTLIGDAAHLMSPYAGAGANLAMRDGLDLGLILAEAASKGWGAEEREAAVKVWEEKMFVTVEKFAAITLKNVEMTLVANSAQSMVQAFRDRAATAADA